jgi:exosome complex component RRP42
MSYPFEVIPSLRREALMRLISDGKRADGRGLYDYRQIDIKVGLVRTADGSALATIGNTKVIAGVKFELGRPFEDTPGEGNLIVNLETPPLASPTFEPGPPDENAIELARVVDRAIRHSGFIDMSTLSIVQGKSVYALWVDVYVLNHDGNLMDASLLAAVAALATSQVPRSIIDGDIIKLDKSNKVPLTVNMDKMPITTTFNKIGKFILADANVEEEVLSEGRFTVAFSGDDVVSIQKSSGFFTPLEIEDMMTHGLELSKSIRARVIESLGNKPESFII